jgi:hypothetical protein
VQLLKDVKPQKCGTRLSRAWPPRTFRLKLPVGCLTCPAPASTHGGTALLRKVRSATPSLLTLSPKSISHQGRPTGASGSPPNCGWAGGSSWDHTRSSW